MTAGLCGWLPDFWTLTQQRLPALASVGAAAAAVERGMAAAERCVGVLLSQYRSAVQSVLANPAAAELSHGGLLSIANELAGGCQGLQAAAAGGGLGGTAAAAPAAAVECLQQLTAQAVVASLAQLSDHLAAAVTRFCAKEDYVLTPASRRAGAPATSSVATLQRLMQEGMQHMKAALAAGARADADPLRTSAAPARAVFFGCFSAFSRGKDSLATALMSSQLQHQPGSGVAAASSSSNHHIRSLAAEAAAAAPCSAATAGVSSSETHTLSPSRRLLLLCANLSVVRRKLLPQLYTRWATLLQAGGSGKELQAAAQAAGAELEAVETRLAGGYIDRKQVGCKPVRDVLFGGAVMAGAAQLQPQLRAQKSWEREEALSNI
jgi:hypothetical protein